MLSSLEIAVKRGRLIQGASGKLFGTCWKCGRERREVYVADFVDIGGKTVRTKWKCVDKPDCSAANRRLAFEVIDGGLRG